jgi:hypothetical protein
LLELRVDFSIGHFSFLQSSLIEFGASRLVLTHFGSSIRGFYVDTNYCIFWVIIFGNCTYLKIHICSLIIRIKVENYAGTAQIISG